MKLEQSFHSIWLWVMVGNCVYYGEIRYVLKNTMKKIAHYPVLYNMHIGVYMLQYVYFVV